VLVGGGGHLFVSATQQRPGNAGIRLDNFQFRRRVSLRLALLWAVGGVAGVDGNSLVLGSDGDGLQLTHCKGVTSSSCNSLEFSEKCHLSY
jgi:hypothetical protein